MNESRQFRPLAATSRHKYGGVQASGEPAEAVDDADGDILAPLRRTAVPLALVCLSMLLWSGWLLAGAGDSQPTSLAMAVAAALLLAFLARRTWRAWQTASINAAAHVERCRLAAAMFDHSCEGILIADAERNIVIVNPAFTAITGYAEADVLGRNPRLLSAGRHDADFYRQMWASINSVGHWHGEIWNRRKDGGVYAEWLSIARIVDDSGRVENYVSIFSDITERKRIDEQIQRLAYHDPLTGLPNRSLLIDRAMQALSLAQRNAAPVTLMYMDLDHFKQINDSLGHRIGDQLLINVANRLLSAVRDYDTVSRQGGDEFVLVLPGTGADSAVHVAEKLRELIAQPMIIEDHEMAVTTSIGIALFPGDASDFEALLRAADLAMYRAKQEGRNGYRFYDPQMQSPPRG